MNGHPVDNLTKIARQFRNQLTMRCGDDPPKRYVLLYAYNGTGKTRLSTAFKDLGKAVDTRDTLYFNAFTEDLFTWDNDLEHDRSRALKINTDSRFFAGLEQFEMDNRIRPLLDRYADFDFRIDTETWTVTFSREVQVDGKVETIEDIKVSRGEENIFIWCFFLAIVQLALDGEDAYAWVKYLYIDDPISSLDEHNAIAVANHLAHTLKQQEHDLKTVISTHHTLFFNVLCNEFKKAKQTAKFVLAKQAATPTTGPAYVLHPEHGDTPFLHHVAALVDLHQAAESGQLYTHHFNMLRVILEKTASFHGYKQFGDCIKQADDDPEGVLHTRIVNILNHGNYSLYEPREMVDENKAYFRRILNDFLTRFPFNPALLPVLEAEDSRAEAAS